MSVSNNTADILRPFVGLHNVAIVDPKTGATVFLKALANQSIDFSEESISLSGGDTHFPFAADITGCKSEITVEVEQFGVDVLSLIYHNAQTITAAETAGVVVAPTNLVGTSIVSSTGIASIAPTDATAGAGLKEGDYQIRYFIDIDFC